MLINPYNNFEVLLILLYLLFTLLTYFINLLFHLKKRKAKQLTYNHKVRGVIQMVILLISPTAFTLTNWPHSYFYLLLSFA